MPDLENLRTVVFIDDDDIAHYLLKSLMKLQRPDLTLTSLMSPYEALDLIANRKFDPSVVFLDINMPKMNGWEFLKEMENLNQTVPVYILSSSEDAQDMQRVKEFRNVLGYFTKPLTAPQLTDILNKHLPVQ